MVDETKIRKSTLCVTYCKSDYNQNGTATLTTRE